MPQGSVLLCPGHIRIGSVRDALKECHAGTLLDFVDSDSEVQLVGQSGEVRWHIWIRQPSDDFDAISDYRTNEDLPHLSALVDDTSVFTIGFNDYERARDVVAYLLTRFDAATCWLDNDYGVVLRGDDVLRRIDSDPEWDWRTTEPQR